MGSIWPRMEALEREDSPVAEAFHTRHHGVAGIARGVDALTLAVVAFAVPMLSGRAGAPHAREFVVAALGAAVVFVLHDADGRYALVYRVQRVRMPFRACLPAYLSAWLAMPLILLLLGRGLEAAGREALLWAALSLPALLVQRRMVGRALAHDGLALRLRQRVVVVGEGQAARQMAERLAIDPLVGVVAVLDRGDAATFGRDLDRVLHGGEPGPDGAGPAGGPVAVDGVVLALPYERRAEARAIALGMRRVHADVFIDPMLVADDPLRALIPLGGATLAVVQRRPLTFGQSLRKSAFDRAVACLILVPGIFVILALMAVVRLGSRGPALFRQPRIGLHGRRFMILKLRTMHVAETDLLADRQTRLGDPRVTRQGRWLRKLSLDELPQLINVLRGEMSLVGPRPHAPNTRASGKLLDDALAEYVIRHQVKPGITGWAQVNGARGQLETVEQLRRRVELDLEYMQRWSLAFDLRILLLTVFREVFSKHAY